MAKASVDIRSLMTGAAAAGPSSWAAAPGRQVAISYGGGLPDPATFRTGVRYVDTHEDRDILLDCQICANTPVLRRPSSPRRAHIDQSVKLFFGLYYFRRPDDDSTGGHLELYRYRRGVPEGFVQKSTEPAKLSRAIPDSYLDVVQTIRNEPNLLFFALNSVYATHGVSVRSVTSVPRNFVNLLGDLREPLFRDVQIRHDFHARDDRGLKSPDRRRRRYRMQHAVDSVAHAKFILEGFDMNVRRSRLNRLEKHLIHELDDRRVDRVVAQILRHRRPVQHRRAKTVRRIV